MTGGGTRTIRVIHPKYGEYTAKGVKDRYEAVIQAARSWGEQWSRVAKKARFEEIQIGVPGGPTGPLGKGGAREQSGYPAEPDGAERTLGRRVEEVAV